MTWGEGSADEMTGLIIGGVTASPKDEGTWLHVIGHYLEIERRAADAKKTRR